ncbi:response regulator transcription factor [Actinokineospora enzanensis]|uniref:response regulator transcription factor n=1 Tax=Actinokineospora enzanensis TaxID=155975 RepID=UPI00035F7E93|nr:LuxR C-terminal-related transcriptional regulator [Actinokineospora enzanensis]
MQCEKELCTEGLDPEDRKLIRLMAMGHGDEYIAKSMSISVRTARRRIARLMTELGARNRFAAGVAAVQRGWLES